MFNVSYDDINVDLSEEVTVYDPRDDERSLILPLQFTCDDLDIYCSYVMCLSDVVSRAALINAKTMFEIVDKRPYFNNDNIKARFEFITLVLEARVDLTLESKSLILSHVIRNCDQKFKEIIEKEIVKSITKTSDTTCKYLNNVIHENLVEGSSLVYAHKLMDIYDKKSAGGYKRLADFSNDIKNLFNSITNTMRKTEEYLREGQGFDLSESSMKATIPATTKQLRKPTNKLATGLQYLNKMLNGGLESGRSYLCMGVTGVGKSIVLLSIALWIMKYNEFPDDGYKKAVLFISQENSKTETFERLYNIGVSGEDLQSMSDDEISDQFKKANLIVNDNDNKKCNFIFRYFEDKEIGVTDIDSLIADFERQNIKIVCVVQDYIEKLKPKHTKGMEMRHILGSLATEISQLAKKWKIPVVSAAQLNRLASSVVDNAVSSNKTNTTKLLGKQNISESWDMMKNIDAAIIINREIDDTQEIEKQYMGFKLEKYRGKPAKDKVYLFLHPFNDENQILLTPDVDLTRPLSKVRLEDFSPLTHGVIEMRQKNVLSTSVALPEEEVSEEFMDELIDMIDGNFKDSDKNYVELYKNAEKAKQNISKINEMEKDVQELRKSERKKLKLQLNVNGFIPIGKKIDYEPERRDGCVVIKSSKLYNNIETT